MSAATGTFGLLTSYLHNFRITRDRFVSDNSDDDSNNNNDDENVINEESEKVK